MVRLLVEVRHQQWVSAESNKAYRPPSLLEDNPTSGWSSATRPIRLVLSVSASEPTTPTNWGQRRRRQASHLAQADAEALILDDGAEAYR